MKIYSPKLSNKIFKIIENGLNENKEDLQILDIEDIQYILNEKYNINLNLNQIGGYLSYLLQDNKICFDEIEGTNNYYAK